MNIHCGGGIFMGDIRACDAGGWDHVVHFVRGPGDPGACSASMQPDAGLVLLWKEHDPIEVVAQPLLAYARDTSGRLLIHCQSGHHRAPHGALIAAIGRGLDPCDVMATLTRERFRLRRFVPDWQPEYLNIIMRLSEQTREEKWQQEQ